MSGYPFYHRRLKYPLQRRGAGRSQVTVAPLRHVGSLQRQRPGQASSAGREHTRTVSKEADAVTDKRGNSLGSLICATSLLAARSRRRVGNA